MARPPLTRRQSEVLARIVAFLDAHGYAPTLEELGAELGLNRVTVFEHVKALERKGRIRTERHLSRSIEVLEDPATSRAPRDEGEVLHVRGRIAAGQPLDAIEDVETFEWQDFVPPGRNCFLLRVQGDSMIEDQIRDGDLVLVEERREAQPAETVVALIDGETATLKRFYPLPRQRVRLEPRNEHLQAMEYPASRVQVQGVVVGVLRRY